MTPRNQAAMEEMLRISECMDEVLYYKWLRDTQTLFSWKSLTQEDYAKHILMNANHNPKIATYEPSRHHVFNFDDLRMTIQQYADIMPHIQIAGCEGHTTGSFVIFSEAGHTEHLFKHAFDCIVEPEVMVWLICGDKFEAGMGDDMPYQLTMPIGVSWSRRTPHPNEWREMLPLCDDFWFNTEARGSTDQVTMYFRDEEDFVEASLIANADAPA